jgi:hypothetical protein
MYRSGNAVVKGRRLKSPPPAHQHPLTHDQHGCANSHHEGHEVVAHLLEAQRHNALVLQQQQQVLQQWGRQQQQERASRAVFTSG